MFLLNRLTRINPIAEVFDREGVIGLRREHGLNYLLDSSGPFAHKCFPYYTCAGQKTHIHKFNTSRIFILDPCRRQESARNDEAAARARRPDVSRAFATSTASVSEVDRRSLTIVRASNYNAALMSRK